MILVLLNVKNRRRKVFFFKVYSPCAHYSPNGIHVWKGAVKQDCHSRHMDRLDQQHYKKVEYLWHMNCFEYNRRQGLKEGKYFWDDVSKKYTPAEKILILLRVSDMPNKFSEI